MGQKPERKFSKVLRKKEKKSLGRRFKFVAFSDRIAGLKIDPVRRSTTTHGTNTTFEADAADAGSYFRLCLDKWSELNLSEHFTQFFKEVDPLCDSLAQIVHHQEKISQTLISYLESGCLISLEPLLALSVEFAHDLGQSFEPYFAPTVTTIANIAANNPDFEVIEWSFNCLAWLFKYLSRLLVPDLTHLYDILAPLFGQEKKQKDFVARFVAEAFSYLIRRAAALYHKVQQPLTKIVHHILTKVTAQAEEPSAIHLNSLSTLFTESIKGVNGELALHGQTVFNQLLIFYLSSNANNERLWFILITVLDETMVSTSTQAFANIIDCIVHNARGDGSETPPTTPENVAKCMDLLLTTAYGRGQTSTTIKWGSVLDFIASTINLVTSQDHWLPAAPPTLSLLAACHKTEPGKDIVKYQKSLLHLQNHHLLYLKFCQMSAMLQDVQFLAAASPYLNQVLNSDWELYLESATNLVLSTVKYPSLLNCGIKLPFSWISSIRSKLDTLSRSTTEDFLADDVYFLCLLLQAIPLFDPSLTTSEGFHSPIKRLFLQPSIHSNQVLSSWVFGNLLNQSAQILPQDSDRILIWDRICKAATYHWQRNAYWSAVLRFVEQSQDAAIFTTSTNMPLFQTFATQALELSSHNIRNCVLQLILALTSTDSGRKLLNLAISIEETQPSLENMRIISMKMQTLATIYHDYSQSNITWELQAIRSLCFGLLHVRLASVWKDSCDTLQAICMEPKAESHVSEIALRWLSHANFSNPELASHISDAQTDDDLDIHSIKSWQQDIFLNPQPVTQILRKEFDELHNKISESASSYRSQALRVLNAIPTLAERHSVQFVPVLLAWVFKFDENKDLVDESGSNNDSWNRKDQKDLVAILAKFTKPKTLHRSEQVYDALLALLTHADGEIQHSAFKALMAWKDKTLIRYKDQIVQFFDDARFRDQLGTFFFEEAGEDCLKQADHPVVMPVLIRILFGRLLKRGKTGGQSNRKAVFGLLIRLGPQEMNRFLSIALGPLKDVSLSRDGNLNEDILSHDYLLPRKQYGMLNMIKDMMDTLATFADVYVKRLIDPVMWCFIRSNRALTTSSEAVQEGQTMFKNIRSLSLNCLSLFFSYTVEFSWDPYLTVIFLEFVSPRVKLLVSESSQGVSGLLKLFSIWAHSSQFAHVLLQFDTQLLVNLGDMLGFHATKEEVSLFVLEKIFLPLSQLCIEDATHESIRLYLCQNSGFLFQQVNKAMNSNCSKQLLEQAIHLLESLAQIGPLQSAEIILTTTYLLRQSAMRVNSQSKSRLLQILSKALLTDEIQSQVRSSNDLFENIFGVVCSTFTMYISGGDRIVLCNILEQISALDSTLSVVPQLVHDINAVSNSRVGEPDFEKRAKAYHVINEQLFGTFTARQWAPILSNALFYIRDVDELAIRSSASHSIRRFVEAVSLRKDNSNELLSVLEEVVIPSIQTAVKHKSEQIRSEHMAILAHILKCLPDLPRFKDLQCLRWGGQVDEDEASFFANILHIQEHRRLRALIRLEEQSVLSSLSPKNISHVLIPLLEHFVFEPTSGSVAGEASRAIGQLSEWMDFPQYRSLIKRYVSYIQSKPEIQETILKLLNNVTKSLSHCAQAKSGLYTQTTLFKTLPNESKLPEIVSGDFLPQFYKFLQEKDESFVSRRIAAATVAARIMQILPPADFALRFPPLLTDTCNILKSRDQASRDTTRNALSEMCRLVGPSSIGFVVRELRRALQRGFFLHVLGFTVHSILESCMSELNPGDIDYCAQDIVAVIMDDTFGTTGQEKEVAEYIKNTTGKREIKGKKSFDTMQLLSSKTTLHYLIDLVRPVEMLLMEKLNHKMMQDVDEILRRIELGVVSNPSVQHRDILVFSYQVIQDAYKVSATETVKKTHLEENLAPLPLPLKKSREDPTMTLSKKSRIGRIVRFGLDLVRSVLKKHKELKTPENIAGFLPVIRDAFNQPQEDIKMAAIRLFNGIVGIPFAKIDVDAIDFIDECIKLVDNATSTSEEIAQAAIKLVATTLRERKQIKIPEHRLALLLSKIRPDLQSISQQGVAFNLVRAIISAQIVVPEMYDLIDGDEGIASIAVRDHDRTTRDVARGVYFQFLMEYPQAKRRFGKQLTFLVRNLEYQYPEGRQSVMEALNHLLNKVDDSLGQIIVQEAFWPTVAVMINDEDSNCRIMANGLVKTIFGRANDEWCRGFLRLFWKMVENVTSPVAHKRTALQCWMAYVERRDVEAKEIASVLKKIKSILEYEGEVDGSIDDIWQSHYYAMVTLETIHQKNADQLFTSSMEPLWNLICNKLQSHHSWVKMEAAKCIDLLTTRIVSSDNHQVTMASLPLIVDGGLQLSQRLMCEITFNHLLMLQEGISIELAAQAAKTVVIFGRVFAASNATWSKPESNRRSNSADKENAEEDEVEEEVEFGFLDDDEEEGDDVDGADSASSGTAIEQLLYQLSYILRKESHVKFGALTDSSINSIRKITFAPRLSALHIISQLVPHIPAATLSKTTSSSSSSNSGSSNAGAVPNKALCTILTPLTLLSSAPVSSTTTTNNHTKDNEAYATLVSRAHELTDALQKRVGTSAFVAALGQVQRRMGERRDERRRKRRMVAVGMPEVQARQKMRKREKVKAKRKEKGLVERGVRRGW